MSKNSFKEQLRLRNVSNTPESRDSEKRFGKHFDSNRDRKGWSDVYKKPNTDKQDSER